MLRRRDVARLALAGVQRGIAEELYLLTGINRTRPTSVRITLTERCNYRCRYCIHWRQERYRPELSLENWKGILRALRRELGPFPVQFLGGEPFIFPGFLELLAFCRDQNIAWGVITNGSALNARAADAVVAASPTNFDISIDALESAIHDHARGITGSLRHVTANVDRLIAARDRAGATFPIRIKVTVQRGNLAELRGVAEWCAERPGTTVDYSPVRLWRENEIAEMYVSSAEDQQLLRSAVDELVQLKRLGWPIETSEAKLRAMVDHFAGKRHFPGVKQCRVGLRTFDILPDGEVRHCWQFGVGHLRANPPDALWRAPNRKQIVAETLRCELAGGGMCGSACTSHRSFGQEARRALAYLAARRA